MRSCGGGRTIHPYNNFPFRRLGRLASTPQLMGVTLDDTGRDLTHHLRTSKSVHFMCMYATKVGHVTQKLPGCMTPLNAYINTLCIRAFPISPNARACVCSMQQGHYYNWALPPYQRSCVGVYNFPRDCAVEDILVNSTAKARDFNIQ